MGERKTKGLEDSEQHICTNNDYENMHHVEFLKRKHKQNKSETSIACEAVLTCLPSLGQMLMENMPCDTWKRQLWT